MTDRKPTGPTIQIVEAFLAQMGCEVPDPVSDPGRIARQHRLCLIELRAGPIYGIRDIGDLIRRGAFTPLHRLFAAPFQPLCEILTHAPLPLEKSRPRISIVCVKEGSGGRQARATSPIAYQRAASRTRSLRVIFL